MLFVCFICPCSHSVSFLSFPQHTCSLAMLHLLPFTNKTSVQIVINVSSFVSYTVLFKSWFLSPFGFVFHLTNNCCVLGPQPSITNNHYRKEEQRTKSHYWVKLIYSTIYFSCAEWKSQFNCFLKHVSVIHQTVFPLGQSYHSFCFISVVLKQKCSQCLMRTFLLVD